MNAPLVIPATARIICGDMRQVLTTFPDECVHAIVTDPPYGLSFMGKEWDGSVPGPDYWREVLRVAKPGAHLLAFGGTRTAHRLACAIEDAGWEIRDCLSWLYGSGFPKSHDVSKAIDREAGAEREVVSVQKGGGRSPGQVMDDDAYVWERDLKITAPATAAARAWSGWGTALKPAWEPIYLARKPTAKGTVASNVVEHGCGGLNIDGCRIASGETLGRFNHARCPADGSSYVVQREDKLIDNSGGLGRWPANLVLDETAAAMLDAQTGELKSGQMQAGTVRSVRQGSAYGVMPPQTGAATIGDSGGASRFFYVAKASRSEREAGLEGNGARANTHPTVKPIALLRYLVRLITPPGGIVLDPFLGSGSTGAAVALEGGAFIGIEIDPNYAALACRRIEGVL